MEGAGGALSPESCATSVVLGAEPCLAPSPRTTAAGGRAEREGAGGGQDRPASSDVPPVLPSLIHPPLEASAPCARDEAPLPPPTRVAGSEGSVAPAPFWAHPQFELYLPLLVGCQVLLTPEQASAQNAPLNSRGPRNGN